MSTSHRRARKAASLAAAVELFVTHLLDGAIGLHVVVGPLLWRPSPAGTGGKRWYFIVAVCGLEGFRSDMLSADDEDLALQARALTMMALIERRPRVVHDTDDELEMAKLCEVLWPGERISALRAAVEREYAAS